MLSSKLRISQLWQNVAHTDAFHDLFRRDGATWLRRKRRCMLLEAGREVLDRVSFQELPCRLRVDIRGPLEKSADMRCTGCPVSGIAASW